MSAPSKSTFKSTSSLAPPGHETALEMELNYLKDSSAPPPAHLMGTTYRSASDHINFKAKRESNSQMLSDAAIPRTTARVYKIPRHSIASQMITQSFGENYPYERSERLARRDSKASVISVSTEHDYDDSVFSLEIQRNSGPTSWDYMTSSPSLEIIEDYVAEQDDDADADARSSTVLPCPAVPPLRSRSISFVARQPSGTDILGGRSMQRHVSNDSMTSNDPLDPAMQHSASIEHPYSLHHERSFTSLSYTTKKSLHKKNISQSRLLPLHLNQAPFLTTDRPHSDSPRASHFSDSVKMHWVLLLCFFILPPMWLVLASGTLDTLLQVPSYPLSGRLDSLASAQRQECLQIRRVKQVAAVLGITFWVICLVGFLLGLLLA